MAKRNDAAQSNLSQPQPGWSKMKHQVEMDWTLSIGNLNFPVVKGEVAVPYELQGMAEIAGFKNVGTVQAAVEPQGDADKSGGSGIE